MLRKLLIVLGFILLLFVTIALIGASVDERHTVTRQATLARPPADVWAAVRDFQSAPRWQPGVESAERITSEQGNEVWLMEGSFGRIPFTIVEEEPGRRLVTEIADASLPFGGRWIYEIEPAGGGTRITITEDGYVRNPFFRFMSRFVFGYETTIEEYLEGLEVHLQG